MNVAVAFAHFFVAFADVAVVLADRVEPFVALAFADVADRPAENVAVVLADRVEPFVALAFADVAGRPAENVAVALADVAGRPAENVAVALADLAVFVVALAFADVVDRPAENVAVALADLAVFVVAAFVAIAILVVSFADHDSYDPVEFSVAFAEYVPDHGFLAHEFFLKSDDFSVLHHYRFGSYDQFYPSHRDYKLHLFHLAGYYYLCDYLYLCWVELLYYHRLSVQFGYRYFHLFDHG